MAEALAAAVGEHDFSGFARPGEQSGTVRTLLRAEVERAGWAPLYTLTLEGRGFLRAQVRNLVGTAVAVGLGLAPVTRVAEILEERRPLSGSPGTGVGAHPHEGELPTGHPAHVRVKPSRRSPGASSYFMSRSETASRR